MNNCFWMLHAEGIQDKKTNRIMVEKWDFWKSNINSCLYIKILQIFCYILMDMWYMREGMSAKSLKKKESKEIRVENQFFFSSKESGILKWMHYSSCRRKKKKEHLYKLFHLIWWGVGVYFRIDTQNESFILNTMWKSHQNSTKIKQWSIAGDERIWNVNNIIKHQTSATMEMVIEILFLTDHRNSTIQMEGGKTPFLQFKSHFHICQTGRELKQKPILFPSVWREWKNVWKNEEWTDRWRFFLQKYKPHNFESECFSWSELILFLHSEFRFFSCKGVKDHLHCKKRDTEYFK